LETSLRERKIKLVEEAVEYLQQGELIVYPTDTLYALGADVFNEEAVRRIYEVKRRPMSQPLPVAVSNIKEISRVAEVTEEAMRLAEKFLPGPLTLVLPRKHVVPSIVTGGGETIAVRVPNNLFALTLLSRYGPLTATSANIHGTKPLSIIKDIKIQLRDNVKLYIEEGELKGLPSTMVDLTTTPPKVIREGVIPKKQVLSVIEDE